MIAAIAIKDNNIDSEICLRFARSRFFAIINTSTETLSVIENPYLELKKAAGYKLVEMLINDYNVTAFVAFEIGLKVQQLAAEKNIQLIVINKTQHTLSYILKMMGLNFYMNTPTV